MTDDIYVGQPHEACFMGQYDKEARNGQLDIAQSLDIDQSASMFFCNNFLLESPLATDLYGTANELSGPLHKFEPEETDFQISSSPYYSESSVSSSTGTQSSIFEPENCSPPCWAAEPENSLDEPEFAYLSTTSLAEIDYLRNAAYGDRTGTQADNKAKKRSMTSAFPNEELDMDHERRRAALRTGPAKGDKRRDQLACPFQKRNPHKHQDCLKYSLHRIKDVKQHVYRRHRQPDCYCARCSTVFETMAERDEHIRVAECALSSVPRFEGISDEQKQKLCKSSSRGLDHEKQWFEMWDIIFPGEEHPASAFVGSYTEEMVPLLRNLWINKKTHILDSVLDNNGRGKVGRSELDDIMTSLLNCLEKETSRSLAGYASRLNVKATHFDSDTDQQKYVVSKRCAISPEFDAASNMGFQNPFNLPVS
ncbi:hypothetical protein VM1G_02874 [Cytospora mali]|uniref:C2H2-type domain-containing protein n=1 Tax=Cytospora mali TaxID=578113 RepID=A0A194VTM6_CYTMA|nr:hypothetical protein VM1G_02874 [Valsa mali]